MKPSIFEPGQRLGDYELLDKIKSGGMATLYVARRRGPAGFSREVAIKVMHPHLAEDPSFVRMFLNEAHLSSRLRHPNAVHVEELGEHQGFYYLVMEFVEGWPLGELIVACTQQKRELPVASALSIALDLADALHAAHETRGEGGELLGVIHRDVSPQNILLSKEGHVKLIDFGIAKIQGSHTLTGGLKGKISYMSPEQAAAESIDRRTDVYALGVVLWEMLTRRKRFHAPSSMELLAMVCAPEPIPAARYAPSLDPKIDAVLARAMALEPQDRFASARELRRALAAACPEALEVDADDRALLLREILGERPALLRPRAAEPREPREQGRGGARPAPPSSPLSAEEETLGTEIRGIEPSDSDFAMSEALSVFDHLPERHSSGGSEMHVGYPAPGLLLTRIRGHLDATLARALVESLDKALTRAPRLECFHDWSGVVGYDLETRLTLTRWSVAHRETARGHILLHSSLLVMGVAVANAALGGDVLRSYRSRTEFGAELLSHLARV